MNLLTASLILLFCSVPMFATAQDPDRIIHEGKTHNLFSNPLENYYNVAKNRPRFMIKPFTRSTGNWRGYIATWQIDEGKLYLTKIDSWLCPTSKEEDCRRVEISELFSKQIESGRVLADWFSGELRVPDGEEMQYVHMGYGSVYERDMMFTVEKGSIVSSVVIDNTNKELPSAREAARIELEKLKERETRRTTETEKKGKPPVLKNLRIVPGQGVFKYGTDRKAVEAVIGEGDESSKFDNVYFIQYPNAGVEVSYYNEKHTVRVIYLYNSAPRYEEYDVPDVVTDKGISWDSTDEEVLKAYGSPLKDFSDANKTWRRLEYQGIDFQFRSGKLRRIGILSPDGN